MNRPMSVKEIHGILTMYGWTPSRQKGSHVIYHRNGSVIVVPVHRSGRGELSWPNARRIIAKARGEYRGRP